MQSRDTIQNEISYREMFEALPVGIALTDPNGVVVYGNKELSRLCGVEDFELNNIFIGCLFHVNYSIPDEVSQYGTEDKTRVNRQELASRPEIVLRTIQEISNKNITKRELDCRLTGSGCLVHVSVNEVAGFICFTIIRRVDESAPVIAESAGMEALNQQHNALTEKVADLLIRNRELIRSNLDLSQYAYVASHDLQEPLRKIRIFSDILIGSQQLTGKEKFLAHKINMATERMSLMIRDLLNYSKLLKAEAVFEQVDLQKILNDVLDDFEVRIQEKKAVITCPLLPEIQAVKLQMNQLFYNLLGNALKFTHPDRPPVIDISANEMDSREVKTFIDHPKPGTKYLHIRFTDHGIGFESKDSEQIFEIFKRLYPREVYEGSGIGLALCRRIVQNHGGYLFAKSAPGEGSTFNIIVPTGQPALRA